MEKAKTAENESPVTAEEIAEKYVRGNHDALTDNQEIKDMAADIEEYASIKAEQARREENEKHHLERIKRIQAELKLREASDLLKKLKEVSGIMYYDLIAQISKYLSDLSAGYEGKGDEQ